MICSCRSLPLMGCVTLSTHITSLCYSFLICDMGMMIMVPMTSGLLGGSMD